MATTATTTTTTTIPPTTTTTTTATETGTKVVTYTPFTAQGSLDPTLDVEATYTATTCGAYGVGGDSSYRCFTTGVGGHHLTYDPCFAPPGATSGPLYCPGRLPSSTVIAITASSLPAAGHTARPWDFQLADGQACELLDAALGGVPPFPCNQPTQSSSVLVGGCFSVQEGSPWWTASCTTTSRHPAPTTLGTYQVAEVWR